MACALLVQTKHETGARDRSSAKVFSLERTSPNNVAFCCRRGCDDEPLESLFKIFAYLRATSSPLARACVFRRSPSVQLAVEEEDVLKEAFFAPRDREGATLQALFEAFSTAAEMNPGLGEDEDGEEPQGEGELVFDHGRYRI